MVRVNLAGQRVQHLVWGKVGTLPAWYFEEGWEAEETSSGELLMDDIVGWCDVLISSPVVELRAEDRWRGE